MAKTVNLYARIEPGVKEQAEDIAQHGISFDMKLPPANILDLSQMTAQELDAELEKGYQDMLAGNTIPAGRAFEELRKQRGL